MWFLHGLLVSHFLFSAAAGHNTVIPTKIWKNKPSLIKWLQAANKKISIARKLRAVPGLGGKPESRAVATLNTSMDSQEGVHLAIVRPFVHSQINALVSSFDDWNKYPLGKNSCAGNSIDVILSFSGVDNNSIESVDVYEAFAKITSLHADTYEWGGCVHSVELMFADIPPNEDLYSDYHSGDGGKNKYWVNGPNRQVCV